MQRQNLHSSNADPESTSWNPESKTVTDYLKWGNLSLKSLRQELKFIVYATPEKDKMAYNTKFAKNDG